MKKTADDKSERVLSIYSRLREGQIIYKEEESGRYGVAQRTIQRDISDIQCFLQTQSYDTGEVQEIVFDRSRGGYRLETKIRKHMESGEILAVCKILLESRGLIKEEMFPIINKLMDTCNDEEKKKRLKEYVSNEMHHYEELHHKKKLLERLGQLESAVREQRYIRIRYKKLTDSMEVVRKVKPVGVMFSEFYFYLTAYIEDIDKEKEFQNPNDIFPTIYRVDRLEEITVLDEHFSVPYAERFEEGEFRKRIQFMYGGRLQKIRFLYTGADITAILDRLPTAVIESEKEGGYIVKAEVFGKGIDMWLRSQGESVKVLE
jgi:predicted DNA-binding transcriptional regulator YafY